MYGSITGTAPETGTDWLGYRSIDGHLKTGSKISFKVDINQSQW